MSIDVKYRTSATVHGGRDGESRTADGALAVKLGVPKEMGGNGQGNNPEQLFAAGYAACFLGAMKFVASQNKDGAQVPQDAAVQSFVGIGPRSDMLTLAGGRGWIPPGREANAFYGEVADATRADLKESWTMGRELHTGSAHIDDTWFLPNVRPTEVPELAGSLRAPIEATGKKMATIDPKGGNSNVTTDYDVMLNALANDYPEALVALPGRPETHPGREDFFRQLRLACGAVRGGPELEYSYTDPTGHTVPARRYYLTWCDDPHPNALRVLNFEARDGARTAAR